MARAVQPFMTGYIYLDLSGRFRDWEFSFLNCLLNSQLQRVDLGSIVLEVDEDSLSSPLSLSIV